MKNQKEELLKKFYRLLGSKEYFFYGSVFFLLGLAITLPSVFIDYTGYQKIWAVLANFFVLMLAGLGIAESIAIRRILNAILKADLQLNPHHPDHFLGLKPIGTLAVVTALLVATISMLFPLAFEAVSYFESNSPFLKLLTYGFLAFTIVVIFYTFVAPLLAIKKGIEEHKFHFILASELEYQQKLAKFKKGEDKKITKDYLDTLLRERERMEKIKLFPFEAQMLMEITFSLLLPILILILEIKMRTTG